MGYLVSHTRTRIFQEFTKDKQKKYFNLTRSKFISHVDTLYYSVFLKNDVSGSTDSSIMSFINVLEFCKKELQRTGEEFYYDTDLDLLFTRKRSGFYEYCLSKKGYYDIFVCSSLPNNNTPRIHIQLRSVGLWTVGEYQLVLDSYNCLEEIFKPFDISIERTQENRLDYCYHTNSIQNPIKFYNDDNLVRHLKTQFKIYSKVGRVNDGALTVEYLSLGKRTSNNIFFRSYNKTREVIEENYKDFFIEYWFNIGLISYYDMYVYSYAFKKKSYEQIYWGMLEFYLQYGSDINILHTFKCMKDNINTTIDQVRKAVKGVLPFPTLVLNIEFQTMRKFYYSGSEFIDMLPINYDLKVPQLLRIYQILDNRKIFLDYLTSNVVAFVKDKKVKKDKIEYLDFWARLRKTGFNKFVFSDYKRNYTKNINIDLVISRLKGCMATLNLYKNNFNGDINSDMSTLIQVLNDNDMKINDDGTCSIIDKEYDKIREKKKKALKSIINNAVLSPS